MIGPEEVIRDVKLARRATHEVSGTRRQQDTVHQSPVPAPCES